MGLTKSDKFSGWVRPNGKMVEVTYGGHLDAAAALGEASPDAVGWVHVGNGLAAPTDSGRITSRQADALLDLTAAGRITLPFWLADAVA
jgi:hypothetical protein